MFNFLAILLKSFIKPKQLVGIYNLKTENLTHNFSEFVVFLNEIRIQKKFSSILIYIIDPTEKLSRDKYRTSNNYLSNKTRFFNICIQQIKNLETNVNILIIKNDIFLPFNQKKMINVHYYEPNYHQNQLLEIGLKKKIIPYYSEKDDTKIVLNWLHSNKFDSKKIITINLRKSDIESQKNSSEKDWNLFCSYVSSKGYVPIVIPDTDSYTFDNLYKNVFEIGVYNSNLKFSLHKIALNNYFVESGAFIQSVFSENNFSIFSTKIDACPAYLKYNEENYNKIVNDKNNFNYRQLYLTQDNFKVLKYDFDNFLNKINFHHKNN
jgi:hypothetical protein